ncbi:MAG: BON domain-containing protein [Planctomycetota bacterium]|nr:BON domain-containing protein [Planctomycetota bacterium]
MRRFGKWILTAGILAGSAAWMTGNLNSLGFGTTQLSAQTAASQTDNQLMAERIADALRKTNFRGSNIEIIFKNGVATITGKIADDRQKESATKTVLGVRGVKAIDNQLVPIRQSAEPRPQIEQAVATAPAPKPKSRFSLGGLFSRGDREEPVADDAPEAARPDSRSNIVQTGGRQAPQAARQIQQVQQASGIEEGPNGNQQKAEEIGDALKSAKLVGYDIRIGFRNGTAWLYGTVSDGAARARATQIAANVSGVKYVDNQLAVAGQIEQTARPVYPQRGVFQAMGQAPQHPQMNPQLIRTGYQGPQGPPQGAPGVPAGGYPQQGLGNGYPLPPGYPQGGPVMQTGYPGAPPTYAQPASIGNQSVYSTPNLPDHAWPSYAAYPNYAQVSYPKQYDPSAWPYIGPFYPYPQVPMGWRQATLEWDDGHWNLKFDSKTDKPFWFLNPKHW